MKIGIDASRANKDNKTGVEWYSYHLIEQFKKIDHENEYFLYSNHKLTSALADCPQNFKSRRIKWYIPRTWTIFRLGLHVRFGKNKPDVLFMPASSLPVIFPRKSVVTVHDIGFVHFPELYPWADRFYHKLFMLWIKVFATKIIAVSHYTKKDLIETYKIKPEKIEVVYNGYDGVSYKQMDLTNEDLLRYGIRDPYILFIGRLEQKKNIVRLVEAFAELKKRNQNLPHKLVLVGRPGRGDGYEEAKQKIKDFGLVGEVIILGWLSSQELPILLNKADLFIFPSLFEGFGIPVIEAMACGCPVACSKTTSLPEVAGEAALMFDPENVEEIRARMEQVLLNKEVVESLREKGLRRAEQFSWEKSARETLKILLK
jgi:glycosyltransferase involved in cell wall biosynthesis